MKFPLNTLGLSHQFISSVVKIGDICIDATAGKGRDTAFLCSLVGESGKVFAFDIQESAVMATKSLLKEKGYENISQVYCRSHSEMGDYAKPESVSAIMFNLGWLPGGDHNIFSKPETTIKAINTGLGLLKSGGVMSICIYYGKETGYSERDAILPFLKTIDNKKYTVIVSDFVNRTGEIPIPVFIVKE